MLTYHFISPSNPCQPRVRMATGCHADNLPSRYLLQRDKRTNVVFLFILPKYFANYLCLGKPYLAFSCSENRQMSARPAHIPMLNLFYKSSKMAALF